MPPSDLGHSLDNFDRAQAAIEDAMDWSWNLVYWIQDHHLELEPDIEHVLDDLKAAQSGLELLRKKVGLPTLDDLTEELPEG
mgnify:CR=1 FL=1